MLETNSTSTAAGSVSWPQRSQRAIPLLAIVLIALAIHGPLLLMELPLRSYEVLLRLEDAAGHRRRMTELCRDVVLSASGVSRLVDRLEKDGYVRRERCAYDGRGFFAVLTPSGERRLQEARATHLAGVRRLFLERLQAADLVQLAQYWEILVPGSTAPTADSRPE